MKKVKQNNKGITLIALVVTIVVLLILAGITITTLFGDNGLITRAKIADQKTQEGAQKDIEAIENLGQQVNTLVNGGFTDIYVTLYTDGTLGFSNNTETIEGKTVQTSYGNIKNQRYYIDMDSEEMQFPPWSENESVQTVVFTNEIVPQSTSFWFSACFNLTEIQNIGNLNTSKVTDMSGMFYACEGLTSLDVSNFDTSTVTDMFWMFYDCCSLTSLNLSNFNTSNVTNMYVMFGSCENLTSLDISNFDTSNVTDMSGMFSECLSLETLNVTNFDTSNVTNMSGMFDNCSGLTSLNLSNFNTNKVTDMSHMFAICSGLASLDLSTFDTSQVTDMESMFGNLGISELDLSGFNTSEVTSMEYMFNHCENLITIYASSNFKTTKVTSSNNMFIGCSNLVGGNGTTVDTYNGTNIGKEYARIDAEGTPGFFTAK